MLVTRHVSTLKNREIEYHTKNHLVEETDASPELSFKTEKPTKF